MYTFILVVKNASTVRKREVLLPYVLFSFFLTPIQGE